MASFSWSPATDQAIAGFIAGASSTIVLHPMDLIKNRFQINENKNHSFTSTGLSIVKREGLRGLYRGLGPNFWGATCSWGFYFYFYQIAKDGFQEAKLRPEQHLMASAAAGALTASMTNPIWVVKLRMVTQNAQDPNAYTGLIDGLQKMWKHEGIRGFYRGFVPALFGVSHGALQFMAYEFLKAKRIEQRGHIDKMPTLEYITMAVISKTFATVLTYPYQVVKARLQVQPEYVARQYNGVLATIGDIYKHERIYGFYKGMGVNIIRVMPGTCITFGVYEAVSALFRLYAN
ncbi:mitochondrial carrier domain-containing protein [Gorgonomyces haynaldii]|nr:mitochondrial carrier domain-containing protein [Gorgonomyces haynaldii]